MYVCVHISHYLVPVTDMNGEQIDDLLRSFPADHSETYGEGRTRTSSHPGGAGLRRSGSLHQTGDLLVVVQWGGLLLEVSPPSRRSVVCPSHLEHRPCCSLWRESETRILG